MIDTMDGAIDKTDCSSRHWCLFIRDRRWSLRQKHELLQRFKSPDVILSAAKKQFVGFVTGKQMSKSAQVSEKAIRADLRWLEHPDNHLVTCQDKHYPEALKQLPDAPISLFAIGDLTLLSEPQVAIVGARRPTPVGLAITDKIAMQLAKSGIGVTSGMALGVDGAAHVSALKVGGASTAVLASGLDRIAPTRHRQLFNQLADQGLVLSEYPLGYPATRYTFPARNRIVSGLSLGVVIIEAAERSGTLITARLATEQNRDVMVVPGSVLSAQYRGSHALIQQGAALVASGEDVLRCLSCDLESRFLDNRRQPLKINNPSRQTVNSDAGLLRYISVESTSVDEIILASGLTAAEVSSMLITLEIEGVVAVSGDGGYINLS